MMNKMINKLICKRENAHWREWVSQINFGTYKVFKLMNVECQIKWHETQNFLDINVLIDDICFCMD